MEKPGPRGLLEGEHPIRGILPMISSVGAKVDEFSLHGLGPPPGFCNCGDLAKSVVDMLTRLEILLFQRMPSLAL